MREGGCGFESRRPCSVPKKWHDLLLEMGMGVQWPVGPPPLNFFAIFFWNFLLFTYCLCRGSKQHMAKALLCAQKGLTAKALLCAQKGLTAKLALPADICRVLFAACYTWLSLCRVHKGLCRMPQANFFAIVFWDFLLFTYYLCRGSKQHMAKALSCVRRKAHGKIGFAGWYLLCVTHD